MDSKYNPALTPLAKQLRKNMTREERHLWYDFLRAYPIKFTRQKVLGRYIVDFYSPTAKLVIELDGSQHYDQAHLSYDSQRTEYLEAFDLKIIRIPNNAVMSDFSGVCALIDRAVKQALT